MKNYDPPGPYNLIRSSRFVEQCVTYSIKVETGGGWGEGVNTEAQSVPSRKLFYPVFKWLIRNEKVLLYSYIVAWKCNFHFF